MGHPGHSMVEDSACKSYDVFSSHNETVQYMQIVFIVHHTS